MSIDDTLVMILAGGVGKRLYPLTQDRAKPAVPFGGRYRIIDFVLNNFINSGFFKIKVLTQYKSDSLNKHITRGWNLSPFLNQYVDLVPAQRELQMLSIKISSTSTTKTLITFVFLVVTIFIKWTSGKCKNSTKKTMRN